MPACWLYIYENSLTKSMYVGIADNMRRVFEDHNAAAEALRDAPGSVILQTVQPFSSRADARKAEAIAIHIAAFARACSTDSSADLARFTSTNIAGLGSTDELGPAILTRGGTVDAASLRATIIVPIAAEAIDHRPAPFGAHVGARFSERARQFWNVRPDRRSRVRRLLAVLKGGSGVILGDWDITPDVVWETPHAGSPSVAIPLADPDRDDPRGVKGKRLTGHRMNSGVGYSADVR